MNVERFIAIVEAYGADPERWPEAEREAARAVAQTPAGAAALAEARLVDELLAFAPPPRPPSDLLERRILASRAKAGGAAPMSWRPLAALAACAVFGVLVGFGVGTRAPSETAADAVLSAAFEAPTWEEGWDEG